jgi:hypothetical protein
MRMSFGETESSMSLPSREDSVPPLKVSVRPPPGLIAGTWHRPLFLTRDRWFESGSLQRRVINNLFWRRWASMERSRRDPRAGVAD